MQRSYYLVTDSITAAMKGYRILSRMGFNTKVERLSPIQSKGGCGYSIVVYSDHKRAMAILKKNNIKIKTVIEK